MKKCLIMFILVITVLLITAITNNNRENNFKADFAIEESAMQNKLLAQEESDSIKQSNCRYINCDVPAEYLKISQLFLSSIVFIVNKLCIFEVPLLVKRLHQYKQNAYFFGRFFIGILQVTYGQDVHSFMKLPFLKVRLQATCCLLERVNVRLMAPFWDT